jgi:hypothetical protein
MKTRAAVARKAGEINEGYDLMCRGESIRSIVLY